MNTLPSTTAHALAAGPSRAYLPMHTASPDTPAEAAQAFAKIFVRRFVEEMTKNMFDGGLSGKNGPSWMQSQRNYQHSVLTKVLADQLVEADLLGLSEMLLHDWGLTPESSSPEPSPDASAQKKPPLPSPPLEALPARLPKIALRIPFHRR